MEKNNINILVCEDPDKEAVLARIKQRGVITIDQGIVDDFGFYPNGYYEVFRSRKGHENGVEIERR